MPSIIEKRIEDRLEFRREYRKVYLQSVCAQMGMPTDLRLAALREAKEMIEFAESLLPKY